jgi:hypothetical protein
VEEEWVDEFRQEELNEESGMDKGEVHKKVVRGIEHQVKRNLDRVLRWMCNAKGIFGMDVRAVVVCEEWGVVT